jgi:hypothetical protein
VDRRAIEFHVESLRENGEPVSAQIRLLRQSQCSDSASVPSADGAQMKTVLHLHSICIFQPAGHAIASANPGNAADTSSMCALAMPSSSRASTPLTVVSCSSARYSSMST